MTAFCVQFQSPSRRLGPPPRVVSPPETVSARPAPAILQNERASSIATRLQEKLRSGAAGREFELLKQEQSPGTYFEAK